MKKNLYILVFLFTFLALKSHAQCIFTVAGNGYMASSGYGGYSGDGGPATAAEMYFATGIALDPLGNIYISDQQNCIIRKVTKSTGIITTIAGHPGIQGSGGDGGPATASYLNWPSGLAFDKSGNLYVADQQNYEIREISTLGIITTIAGTGVGGINASNGPATSVQLYNPTCVTVDGSGNLFIADAGNNVIRKVSGGNMTVVAGNGNAGYIDSVSPILGELNNPTGVALDASGNLYIADKGNNRIRKVVLGVLISTVAGNGTAGYTGDGNAASGAELYAPIGITIDQATGNLYIADENNNRIRKVSTSGIINTIAGNNSTATYYGDGGPATAAGLSLPWAVAIDPAGNIFIPDNYNNVVREIRQCNGVNIYINPPD
jgi:sugar lactone lactonase YvrE